MRIATGLASALLTCLFAGCGDEPTEQPGSPEAGRHRTIAEGGALYDKFWSASTADRPTTTHPLWARRPDAESNERAGADTWRCKECHGWDYKGVDGAYAEGSHRTGFPGLLGGTKSAAEIVASLAETHGYRTAGLGDADLERLAAFVSEGLVDTTTWIDENGAFRGDVARGRLLYAKGLGTNRACRLCHGDDGLQPPKGAPPGYGDFVGKIADENPWEFLHKVRFGQPGTKMPAAVAADVPMQDVVDLCAYAQTLPTSK